MTGARAFWSKEDFGQDAIEDHAKTVASLDIRESAGLRATMTECVEQNAIIRL